MHQHIAAPPTRNGQPTAKSQNKTASPGASKAIQRIVLAELGIQVLIEQAKIGRMWEQGYVEIACLLEALPLPTTEFELANRHLQNALHYEQNCEFGAAAFELRMLRGRVQRL